MRCERCTVKCMRQHMDHSWAPDAMWRCNASQRRSMRCGFCWQQQYDAQLKSDKQRLQSKDYFACASFIVQDCCCVGRLGLRMSQLCIPRAMVRLSLFGSIVNRRKCFGLVVRRLGIVIQGSLRPSSGRPRAATRPPTSPIRLPVYVQCAPAARAHLPSHNRAFSIGSRCLSVGPRPHAISRPDSQKPGGDGTTHSLSIASVNIFTTSILPQHVTRWA
jgi:hypothetical protein